MLSDIIQKEKVTQEVLQVNKKNVPIEKENNPRVGLFNEDGLLGKFPVAGRVNKINENKSNNVNEISLEQMLEELRK